MNDNININDSHLNPSMTFRRLCFLHMQQLTNFPYIEKDFDALTDYELLCLVVKYLNDVINNSNKQNESITNLYNAFLELQTYMNGSIQELEDAFNTLNDYVRDYFANLDVQDEINNKLDQMLEDGVLEQIIEQFIQSTAIWCFDTVADMKSATNLIDGSFAKTLGYYSVNDGGGATYKITDTVSLTDIQEELNTGIYATLIGNIISTKQLGLTGLENDNTSILQKVIDLLSSKNGTLIIEDTHNIDGTIGLQMKSNVTITCKNGALKCIPNNLTTTYSIIYLDTVENCVFNNLKLIGDKVEHLTTEGEYGFGLYFNGDAKNIIINNCDLSNFYGDGVLMHRKLVDTVSYNPNHITFNGITYIHECKRQGISILAGEDILIDNLICENIYETNPGACIDLESENIPDNIGNIRINYIKGINTKKCFTMRNRGDITGNISIGTIEQIKPYPTTSGTDEIYEAAFRVFFEYFSNDMKRYKITVDNIYSSRQGVQIENAYDITPLIAINNINTKIVEIVERATPSTNRGVINLVWSQDTELSNVLGNIIIKNYIIDTLREIANVDVTARPYIIRYNGNKNVSDLTLNNVYIKYFVNEINSHVTLGDIASNVLFNNVKIDYSFNNPTINTVIKRRNTGSENVIIDDNKEYYLIPVDDGSANKTFTLRVLNALKEVILNTKGLTTLNINTVYNSTQWNKVFLNDTEITGTDGVYPLGQFSLDTRFIITTKGSYIYIYSM